MVNGMNTKGDKAMLTLTKTARIVWRYKNCPQEPYTRGEPTTLAIAKATVAQLNKDYPEIVHWVESAFDLLEAVEKLNILGYSIDISASQNEIEDMLVLAKVNGELF